MGWLQCLTAREERTRLNPEKSKGSLCALLGIGAWRSLVARLLWEQKVPGSSPGAPTKPLQDKGFRTIRPEVFHSISAEKADGHSHSLGQAIEAFLPSRQVGNCTSQRTGLHTDRAGGGPRDSRRLGFSGRAPLPGRPQKRPARLRRTTCCRRRRRSSGPSFSDSTRSTRPGRRSTSSCPVDRTGTHRRSTGVPHLSRSP
jgi:hypothetical protein